VTPFFTAHSSPRKEGIAPVEFATANSGACPELVSGSLSIGLGRLHTLLPCLTIGDNPLSRDNIGEP